MDSDRFDSFVRSFGQTRTRRQTLRGLAGVLATGVLALSVPEVAAVRCSASNPCPECYRCRRRRCRKRAADYPCTGGTCQDGTCIPQVAPCNAQNCPGCCDGTICKTGTADGACGSNGEGCTSCNVGQGCAGGRCVCDPQSCDGCCDGTTCRGGGTRGACGTGGDACQVCASSETCSDGACVCGSDCVCPALKANCTSAAQCTEGCEGAVACAPIGQLDQNQCCRPFGAPCSTPGDWEECCGVVEGGDLVHCAPNNTCGGPGAQCHTSSICASGVCCGFMEMAVCCAAGQTCEDFQCTG